MQILKKLLLFLFILIISSLLFNGNAQETKISEASEIVEIIDNGCDGEGIAKIDNFTIFIN